MYARIEFDGWVVKRSGIEWIVGEKRDRKINRLPSEEILRPKHFAKPTQALVHFLRETRGCEDPLSVALWAFMLRTALATTMAPGVHIKNRRTSVGLSQRELAYRARVGRRTLQNIEYGVEPRTSTYARILNALEKAEGVFP